MKTYKYVVFLSLCTSVQLAADILQWTRPDVGDWKTPTNWSAERLPGSVANIVDTAILAVNDKVKIELPVTEGAGSVNLEMRTGATLWISSNVNCFREIKLGTIASQGVEIAHNAGSVSASKFLSIGQFSTSECCYEISGSSSLELGEGINIHDQGCFCFHGSEASVSAKSLTINAGGSLQFTADNSGIGTIDLSESLIIQPSSGLVLDLRNYPNTGGTIELVKGGFKMLANI